MTCFNISVISDQSNVGFFVGLGLMTMMNDLDENFNCVIVNTFYIVVFQAKENQQLNKIKLHLSFRQREIRGKT